MKPRQPHSSPLARVVAARLSNLLAEARWRDEQLSVEAQVSARTIASLRRGQTGGRMRRATAAMIAAAFTAALGREITAAYVLGEEQ